MKPRAVLFLSLALGVFSQEPALAQQTPPTWKPTFPRGRSASLLSIQPDTGRVVYEVKYPDVDLTSEVTLDHHVFLKEVFKEKWVVTYEYQKPAHRASCLPDRIVIHEYGSSGDKGKLLEVYVFQEAVGNGRLRYVGQKARERIIHANYFEIVPCRP